MLEKEHFVFVCRKFFFIRGLNKRSRVLTFLSVPFRKGGKPFIFSKVN